MANSTQRLVQTALASDRLAVRLADGLWQTPCLHCRRPLLFRPSGEPEGDGSLEHVVPRAWFGRREAAALTAQLSGPNDPRNLALANTSCNTAKGRGPDQRGPADARARAIVEQLLATRLARYRPPT